MKKYLLLALLFSGLMTSAQTSTTNGNCKAQFKHRVNDMLMSPVASTAINFDDRSEGNITLWWWDFGDGTTSTEQNPLHVFIHPVGGPNVKISPYRTVSLTILTSDSCKSFYSEMINILDGTTYTTSPSCKAMFMYSQTAYDSNVGTASYQLENLSEGDSLSYLWQFDNGKTSTEQNPTVTFDIKPDQHAVSLTVTGKNNCSDTFYETVYIYDPNAPVIDPTECKTAFGWNVNYDIKPFAAALTLDFYCKADPEAVKWSWDFGDGTTSDEQNPTHGFNYPIINDSIPGDPNPFRTICLTVTTVTGCVANSCQTIDIYKEAVPPVDPGPQCHAWIKYYRPSDIVSIPEVIPYQLIDASEGDVVRRLWQFEDGTTSTEATPLVNFDFMKPTQKVSLTIYTSDSCSSVWSEVIYLRDNWIDTSYVSKPVWYYHLRVTGNFPIEMSSCAGTAHAQVYLNDSLVEASNYTWWNGDQGQDIKGLCPTQTYSVKAIAPDGSSVWSEFIFNYDGTISEIPTYRENWYFTGSSDNQQIKFNLENKDLIIEWHLCDGSIVKGDSIPLNLINCGGNEANVVMKDAAGNVVYTDNISIKTLETRVKPNQQLSSEVKVYPNPVKDVLNIQYSGKLMNEMQIDIFDIAGKSISSRKVYNVEPGQNISLNVTSLRNGIYLCKMISGKQVIGLEKFVK
jgi:PKD repeat protein